MALRPFRFMLGTAVAATIAYGVLLIAEAIVVKSGFGGDNGFSLAMAGMNWVLSTAFVLGVTAAVACDRALMRLRRRVVARPASAHDAVARLPTL